VSYTLVYIAATTTTETLKLVHRFCTVHAQHSHVHTVTHAHANPCMSMCTRMRMHASTHTQPHKLYILEIHEESKRNLYWSTVKPSHSDITLWHLF